MQEHQNDTNNASLTDQRTAWGLYRAPVAAQKTDSGRVIARQGPCYQVVTATGEVLARTSGRLEYQARHRNDLPVVGDWVVCKDGLIHQILERRGLLCRRESGAAKQPDRVEHSQLMASHVDTMMMVWAASRDPKGFGMIARFLVMARASDIRPVLVFNKADLLGSRERTDLRRRSQETWPDVPCLLVSALEPAGGDDMDSIDAVMNLLEPGSTGVFSGLSGAGKSSILSLLVHDGSDIRIQEISTAVNKGRHTTTHREIYRLRNGALMVDNPGIREIGLWLADDEGDAVGESFGVITGLAADCRYRDCSHSGEPGCAVADAIDRGALDRRVLEQYRKLERESHYVAARSVRATADRLSWNEQQQRDEVKQWGKEIDRFKKNLQREVW